MQLPQFLPQHIILILAGILFFSLIFHLLTYFFMGKEGRYFLMQNILGGQGTFLGLHNTGKVTLTKVKAEHTFLRGGKKVFLFLPQLINILKGSQSIQNLLASEKLPEQYSKEKDIRNYNEILKTKAILNNRPLYTGTIQTSIACNLNLADEISRAERDKLEGEENGVIIEFLQMLEKYYKDGVREIHIVNPWDIDQLTSYVNMSYTDKDSSGVYNAAIEDTRGLLGDTSKYIAIVAGIALFVILAVVFFLK